MSIERIEPKVTHRTCPACGYLILQHAAERMKFDMPCPECEKHNTRKFQPVKIP